MSTTKFEYTTFGLSEYTTVASKYRKICEDLNTIKGVFLKSKEQKDNIRILKELKG